MNVKALSAALVVGAAVALATVPAGAGDRKHDKRGNYGRDHGLKHGHRAKAPRTPRHTGGYRGNRGHARKHGYRHVRPRAPSRIVRRPLPHAYKARKQARRGYRHGYHGGRARPRTHNHYSYLETTIFMSYLFDSIAHAAAADAGSDYVTEVEAVPAAAPAAAPPPAADNGYCREYTREVMVDGQPSRAYGKACRQPDGSWRIVSQE